MVNSISASPNGLLISVLAQINKKQESSFAQLSTGKQKSSLKDNVTGLGKIENLKSAISAIDKLSQGISTSSNLIGAASGGLTSTVDQLQSLRDLAVQAADGSLNSSQRKGITNQANEVLDQIDSNAQKTEFNDQKLLDGSFKNKQIQVGTRAGDTINLSIDSATAEDLGVNDIDLSTPEGAKDAISAIDEAIKQVVSQQGELGSIQQALDNRRQVNEQAAIVLEKARSTSEDLDIAAAFGQIKQLNIKQQIAIQLLKQDDENKNQFSKLIK